MTHKTSKQRQLFMEAACEAIDEGRFISIIGDTIRNEHIFDINNDNNIGLHRAFWDNEEPIYRTDTKPITQEMAQMMNAHHLDIDQNISDEIDCSDESIQQDEKWVHNLSIDFEKMNITEELAYFWAKSLERDEGEDLKYPLADSFNIARVAQFITFLDDRDAKKEYLKFLKHTLLKGAYEVAKLEGDEEEIAYINHLNKRVREFNTFSDLVAELDFPRFPMGKSRSTEDPIHLLANLGQELYITTSYHNFIERELESINRKPRTRICHWHDGIKVSPEHKDVLGEVPSRESPIVFHLFGLEDYPESLILSENDYLDMLWALGRNEIGANHTGLEIIPSYVEAGLRDSPLLLLGYRLHDWDLRVVLRGLCRDRQGVPERLENKSMAIQIDIQKQPLVIDADHAEAYLRNYYGKQVSNLNVDFDASLTFVKALCDQYYSWEWG